MNVVVGSGPSGVSAAAVLLGLGQPVTMLDAAGARDTAVEALVGRLGSQPPEAWSDSDRQAVRGPLRFNREGAPLKLAFGSDYVYRDADRLLPVDADCVDAYRGLAAGGLSALWGAAILPYSAADLEDWPVPAADLDEHYAGALRTTGLSASAGDLEETYPLHAPPRTRLELSAQARFVLGRSRAHASELARRGIHVGQARLAIVQGRGHTRECVRCGMCLYGCPYGLIYSAHMTLAHDLSPDVRFTYVPGVVVRRLREGPAAVTIEAVSREDGSPRTFEASRVYLGAGTLASTAIVLASLEAYDRPLPLRQSDHGLFPVFLRRRSGSAARERLHTLSQLFVEVLDRSVAPRGAHLQLYTYSDFYSRMAEAALGPCHRALGPLVDRVIDRLAVFKAYLHSDDSDRISATLIRGGEPRLRLEPVPSPGSRSAMRAVQRTLRRNGRNLGVLPVPRAARRGLPGSSVHVGGSFPMRRQPGPFESDAIGRPTGFSRVHLIDASAFPAMAAAPPTLTAMANARRIATCSHVRPGEASCRS